ncbi:rabGTPase-activating protein [Trypanosoma rangeli]|uniref:RabGTPase-activating protein n=1 Tax=Trypanosoma rangeli TaxID=5698 RepID=A0A422NB36_TRYRA|nr:rabGTPase-activating protein [Trypanosoma rangeli]RNF02697.1 rabGTPase-activating protein [Trypanosoma rangeli]|eukprot:RNF02697.1 rabGTPase-activating protein [Trypanosoma rangeli]
MEELRSIHHCVQRGHFEEVLLRHVLNFARHRCLCVFHSLRWRLLLGLLPANVEAGSYCQVWAECTRAGVREWKEVNEHLRQRLVDTASVVHPAEKKGHFNETDSSFSDEDEENMGVENPLLPPEGSSYALQYAVDTIRSTAQKDLDRLHWELPLFEESTTKNALLDIFVNYCLRHDSGYKQGMHEIAAFVMYLTHTDATLLDELLKSSEETDLELVCAFKGICPLESVTAMSFFLFEAIMNTSGLHLSEWYYAGKDNASDGIVGASHKTQKELLAELDPALHQQMNVVYEIEATSYLIRWLRLLFLREFSIPQCADLWDVFLSERFLAGQSEYRLKNSTVTMLAASMLLYVKQDLMVGHIDALKRLMKYPPLEDVGSLLEMTITRVDPQKRGIGRYFTPPESHEFVRVLLPPPAEEKVASPVSLSPIELMNQQGRILASIIERLEMGQASSPSALPDDVGHNAGDHARTIEELKMVRDALLYTTGNNGD